MSENQGVLSQAPPHVAKTCYELKGVVYPFFMMPRCMQDLKQFRVRDDDVFVLTYPKSGTTWTLQLALLAKFDGDTSRLNKSIILAESPFLETPATEMPDPTKKADIQAMLEKAPTFCQVADAMPTDDVRVLKIHSLPKFLPDDITDDPKGRVIYVARNPKDTAVSFYHFCQYIVPMPKYASWSEFFEEFIADRVPFGSWFENVLFWWKLRDHPNVLFLTYEGMKQDGRKAVVQIAEFMGKSFSPDIIDKMAAASTFDAMKKSKSSNPDLHFADADSTLINTSDKKSFFRKGAIGDWKNYFTVDQNERFDKLYNEKVAGSGLELIFE